MIKKKILIVDQNEDYRKSLSRFLSQLSYETQDLPSLAEASDRIFQSDLFSLALVRIPSLDSASLSLLQKIKSHYPGLGLILLSETKNPRLVISLLEEGITDHFSSPDNLAGIFSAIKNEFKKRELLQKNESYLQNMRTIKSEQQKNLTRFSELEEIHDATLDNLMTALDLRDVETFGHSRTVAKYSQALAQILGIKDKGMLDNIRKGSFLHDVGKIAIPDSILRKPTSLSLQEWEKIKLHPSLGFGLIKDIKLVEEVGNIILYHHERFDGSGYPNQLKKESIPLEARIFTLADALDAITSHRPYRKKRSFTAAQKEIRDHSGSQFDPKVVEAFSSLEISKWERIRFETTKLLPLFEDLLEVL